MKIALIGTHGSGKTTLGYELVTQLRKQNKDAIYLDEVARDCPFPINEEATKEAQEWMIYFHYIKELEFQDKCDFLICGKSILDYYVYQHHKFGEDNLIEKFVKEKIKNYKILIRMPINPNYLKKDKKRSINPLFQKEIDEEFNYILDKLKIPTKEYESLNKTIEIIKNARPRSI